MTRILMVLLLLTGIALGWIFGERPAQAQPPINPVVGSYLLRVAHFGFPTIPALATLTRGGGFQASDASDFGAAGTALNSPIYGAWEPIGLREIAVRTIYIAYDSTGMPTALWRTTGSFEFDADFETGTGEMLIEKFGILEDPLDPAATPSDSLAATVTAQRILVP